MSNELTDVRCSCGDEYPADSYDAGFIAGSGMCQNCDAALPPKDICTCPSGNGSLRHPCPAHPAVEQAGGDERDFQAEGAQEVPSPVSQEYDRHLISLLRKGEALPGHQEEAADEIERLRDWNDHLNNTVLPNILNPTFLMLMKGGERLLDLCTKDGEFIGVSLNDMKDVFDWMVTHARIAPDQAALAQPSHAPELAERGTQHRFSTTEQTCRHDFAGVWWNDNGETKTGRECRHCGFFVADVTKAQAEQAEAERPEFDESEREDMARIAFETAMANGISLDSFTFLSNSLAERYERIVGELRSERDAANARLHEVAVACATAEQERDATQARVSELDKQCRDDVARALGLRPNEERGFAWSYLLASIKACVKASENTAQAQHSVPEGWMLVECGIWTQEQVDEMQKTVARFRNSEFVDDRALAMAVADAGQCKAPEISLAELLAAAPGKEGV
ncbi:hypothetical protein [Pseudomonas aeruginosa]|uniref:hypothetical protein n=1 Tax=Pseudomonas aeruginosa TaxID=287 RepID=UPI0019129B6F|nr:hypothetical protein [Pseudomonas aeruginosa]